VVKVCGEEVSEVEYNSAIECFEELSKEVSTDATSKDMKVSLVMVKVSMKKPWVYLTPTTYKLDKREALNFFIEALEDDGIDDLFEVEVKEIGETA